VNAEKLAGRKLGDGAYFSSDKTIPESIMRQKGVNPDDFIIYTDISNKKYLT